MPGRPLAELRLSILEAIWAEFVGYYTAFLFAGLVLTAALVRGLPIYERRRVRLMTFFFAGHVALAIAGGVTRALGAEGATPVHYASGALAVLAGVGMMTTAAWVLLVHRLRLPLPPIVRDLAGATAVLIALIATASRAGINVAGLVATSAVLTAVVGLALQDTLGNLVAGLTLQSDASIGVGEWVKLGDVEGRVVDMRWRFTSIETRNGETLIVPNSSLVKERVMILGRRHNKSLQQRRWIRFYVDLGTPHGKVIETVGAAFRPESLPSSISHDPPVDVLVMGFDHGVVEYAVRYWLTELAIDLTADSLVRERITAALERAGLAHAVPLERRVVNDAHAVRVKQSADELASHKAAIRRIALLDGLSGAEQDALAEQLVDAPFEPGEPLFKQGADGDALYVIAAGRVSVRLRGLDGIEHEIAQLGPGDVLGEMGVMTGDPRTATAVALTRVEAYRLDRSVFQRLLADRPELASSFARVLATRQAAQAEAKSKLGRASIAPSASMDQAAFVARIRSFFGLDS